MPRCLRDLVISTMGDNRFDQDYRDHADGYVPERHSQIQIAQSPTSFPLYGIDQHLMHRDPILVKAAMKVAR
jgi:hypothetical protein